MRAVWSLVLCLAACGGSSDPDVVIDAPLTGEATIRISPTTFDFGEVGAGTRSPLAEFIVTNTGNRSTGTVDTQMTFTNASLFKILTDGCEGGVIAAGGTCSIMIQFQPEAPLATKVAKLLVDSDPGGEQVVDLSGTAVPDTGVRLTTTAGSPFFDFGNQAINTLSPPRTFTILNPGQGSTGHIETKLTGVNKASWSVETSCSAALGPNGTCMVAARFRPTMPGIQPAQIVLDSNPGSELTLGLTGNGVDVALAPVPTMHEFGTFGTGTSSQPVSVTVTNHGTVPSGIVITSIAGASSSDFQIGSDSCNFIALQPGASCFVSVLFAPVTQGAKVARLQAVANNSFANVDLTGTALLSGGGFLSASQSSLTFADQATGTNSASQTIIITNTGAAATGTITVATTGTGAAAFTTANTCTTLIPSQSCNVNVTFSPMATGLAQATVNVTATGSNTVPITVQGTGI